jgi:hypothetical protein
MDFYGWILIVVVIGFGAFEVYRALADNNYIGENVGNGENADPDYYINMPVPGADVFKDEDSGATSFIVGYIKGPTDAAGTWSGTLKLADMPDQPIKKTQCWMEPDPVEMIGRHRHVLHFSQTGQGGMLQRKYEEAMRKISALMQEKSGLEHELEQKSKSKKDQNMKEVEQEAAEKRAGAPKGHIYQTRQPDSAGASSETNVAGGGGAGIKFRDR